jgi:hypothetical protein
MVSLEGREEYLFDTLNQAFGDWCDQGVGELVRGIIYWWKNDE